KLGAKDLGAVRERLRSQSARLRTALHDEVNDLYDDAAGGLSGSGRTLRLRRAAGRAILTYKGRSRFQDGVKTREEREVEVSDGGEAEGILEGLGLIRRFRYEKRREEWAFEGCIVCLDETPIGNFVEVEGDPTAIRRAFVGLGLDFTEAIPYSYAELYQRRRKAEPALPPDMVWPAKG
ncbi:MAG TPA: class IV adenylate cyclase, partial [Thermoanaerobaculia bacterium]